MSKLRDYAGASWLSGARKGEGPVTMFEPPDYYAILQVHPEAEPEVVEAAYRRLARKYHPDVNSSPAATNYMSVLNEAYRVLSDPQKRADYDATRQTQESTLYGHAAPSPVQDEPSSQAHFAEDTPRPTAVREGKQWWRWLLVLPAFLFGLLFPMSSFAGLALERMGLSQTVINIIQSFAGGFGAVYLASIAAPRSKFGVAIGVAAFLVVTLVIVTFWASPIEHAALLSTLAMAVACAAAVALMRFQYKTIDVASPHQPYMTPTFWHWLLKPGWRSIVLWPLALWYLGQFAFIIATTIALHIDLISWNILLWLVLSVPSTAVIGTFPFIGTWLAFSLTYVTWTSRSLQKWWGVPAKLVVAPLCTLLSQIPFWIGVYLVVSVSEASLKISLKAMPAVILFFANLGANFGGGGWWATTYPR